MSWRDFEVLQPLPYLVGRLTPLVDWNIDLIIKLDFILLCGGKSKHKPEFIDNEVIWLQKSMCRSHWSCVVRVDIDFPDSRIRPAFSNWTRM